MALLVVVLLPPFGHRILIGGGKQLAGGLHCALQGLAEVPWRRAELASGQNPRLSATGAALCFIPHDPTSEDLTGTKVLLLREKEEQSHRSRPGLTVLIKKVNPRKAQACPRPLHSFQRRIWNDSSYLLSLSCGDNRRNAWPKRTPKAS